MCIAQLAIPLIKVPCDKITKEQTHPGKNSKLRIYKWKNTYVQVVIQYIYNDFYKLDLRSDPDPFWNNPRSTLASNFQNGSR